MSGDAAAEDTYRGRFAPSPTGPLHFGSLIAAVASYLQARAAGGEWLVRVEDIDPTREIAGATDDILRSLDTHGFEFDTALRQSNRLEVYDEIIARLIDQSAAFPCSCSRKELRASATEGIAGPIYPGTCRGGADTSKRPATSVRVLTDNTPVTFDDLLQGPQTCRLQDEIGDFLIRRGDGLVAYQLAVVVDDHAQQITEVVRGTDLLDATFMQLRLQALLNYPPPRYVHFPVATHPDGRKLSKQTGAPGISGSQPGRNLREALNFLRQDTDFNENESLSDIWKHAIEHWNPSVLRGAQNRKIGV